MKKSRRGREGGEESVMASVQLFAQHGSGHLGNTNPAAKERKTRKAREEGDDGKQGSLTEGDDGKRLFLSNS